MGHGLNATDNGEKSMLFTGETPWHGLGTRFEIAPTIDQAKEHPCMDWRVKLFPNTFIGDDGQQRNSKSCAVMRMDTGRVFGTVGVDWKPVQNCEMLEWFRPFVESGMATIHTAGALYDGEKVWCLAKLDGPNLEIADGDEIARFVLLSNAHDGSRAVRVGFTPIRVVCQNTLSMAHGAEGSKLIKLLHTKNVLQNLTDIRETMNLANQQFEATAEQYRALARKGINQADLRKYVKTVLGVEKDEDAELTGQCLTKIREIEACAKEGRGTRGKTLWDAYNGFTEYLNYGASRKQDTRLESLWFGQNLSLSAKALQVAFDMAS